LLIEEARTNLITYSEDFGNAYWAKNGDASVTANTHVAPDGTTTADTVTGTAGGSGLVFRTGFSSSGQVKSIWARTVSGTGNANIIVDQNSTLVSALTTDWKRIEISNAEDDGENLDVFYAVDFRGGGLEEVVLWGAQLEQGSPSSYIPTAGTQVTRAADNCERVLGDEYNGGGFTVYCKYRLTNLANFIGPFLLTDGTNNNRVFLDANSSGSQRLLVASQGTLLINSDLVLSTLGEHSLAMSFSDTEIIVAQDGVSYIFSGLTSAVPQITNIKIGRRNVAIEHVINSTLKDFRIFPTTLSEAELITLTGGT